MPQLMLAMPPSRIDLGELKLQLAKQLGPERAQRYFGYLHQLLSQKLSKREFDKLCFFTIGWENVSLHNQLIQSVIKNAFQANVPPPSKRFLQREDDLKPLPPTLWSGLEYLPQSPRRRRSVTQRSRFGLNESVDTSVLDNNSDSCCHDLKRQQEGEDGKQAEQPKKMRRLDRNGSCEVVFREEVDSVEQSTFLKINHGPLEAPLGIPFCPASAGMANRSLSPVRSSCISSFRSFSDSSELCSTEDLRIRMEKIAEKHGLGVVELGSANLLNYSLDAYLKQLIKSSIELVCTRVGPETIKQPVPNKKAYDKPINGVWVDSSTHMRDSSSPSDLQERKSCLVTLQDFTVALEYNPHQLGQDSSIWFEKIGLHSFE